MTKVGTFILLSVLIIILANNLASVASATVSISDINKVYNMGDTIKINADVSRAEQFQGFLRVSLVCAGEKTIYYSSIMLEPNIQETASIDLPVTTTGDCYFKAVLESINNVKIEETRTQSTILSSEIEISTTINKDEFLPEEEIKIDGQAIKKNGNAFDGNIRIIFNNKEYLVSAVKGKFSFSAKLEKNIAPGVYLIRIYADENSNTGNAEKNIKITAVPTALLISINKDNFLPDELLEITPKLVDQADGTMPAAISLKLIEEGDGFLFSKLLGQKKLMEELIESGSQTLYRFDRYIKPGKYIIEVETGSFKATKTISVDVLEKLYVEHDNKTLYITNIGNVIFKKPVEIEFKIENYTEKKLLYLNLDVNETKSYELDAPKGTYEISVNTGQEKLNFSGVPLTGNLIMTTDVEKEKHQTNMLYLLLIIVSLALVFILMHPKIKERQEIRHFKTKSMGRIGSGKKLKSTIIMPETTLETIPKAKTTKTNYDNSKTSYSDFSSSENTMKNMFSKYANKLQAYNLIACPVYGAKQEITALSISIYGIDKPLKLNEKGSDLFKQSVNEYFSSIADKIKDYQGVADIYENNIIVLFNVVKQFRHEIAAMKTAHEIRKATEKLNSSLRSLGIAVKIKAGINTGMAIVSNISEKTVRYTSISDTVSLAKALEKKAFENEILISQNVYGRASNVIAAEKITPLQLTDREAIGVYVLKDVSPAEVKEKYKEYVDRVLKRI